MPVESGIRVMRSSQAASLGFPAVGRPKIPSLFLERITTKMNVSCSASENQSETNITTEISQNSVTNVYQNTRTCKHSGEVWTLRKYLKCK